MSRIFVKMKDTKTMITYYVNVDHIISFRGMTQCQDTEVIMCDNRIVQVALKPDDFAKLIAKE